MANDFERQLRAFAEKVRQRQRAIFTGCASEVQRSVVEGSEISGSPALPVDTGNLRTSYIPEFSGPWTWQITTNVEYAPFVESNVNNVTFRNGGPHGIALTVAGWGRIVGAVINRVAGNA